MKSTFHSLLLACLTVLLLSAAEAHAADPTLFRAKPTGRFSIVKQYKTAYAWPHWGKGKKRKASEGYAKVHGPRRGW